MSQSAKNLDGTRYTDVKCVGDSGKTYFLVTILNEKPWRVCANGNFVAIYTDSYNLHVYNLFGMSLSEPFYIPMVCFLECNTTSSLLAVQATGELFLWDVAAQSLVLKTNILALLTKPKPDTLSKVFLDSYNNILLNTASGKVFRYDPSMKIFKKIKDMQTYSIRANIDFEHVKPYSEISKFLFGAPEPLPMEPDRKIDQRRMYQFESNNLEERLATAKAMKLPEYWILFRKYVLLLVEAKNYEKLKALCTELIAIKEGKQIECPLFSLTEDEKKLRQLMGKFVDEILAGEIAKLVEGYEDPNVTAILDGLKLLKK